MFSFVDLRLLLLLAATALLTHGQEEGQEEDSKSQALGGRVRGSLASRPAPGPGSPPLKQRLGVLRGLGDGGGMLRAPLWHPWEGRNAPWAGRVETNALGREREWKMERYSSWCRRGPERARRRASRGKGGASAGRGESTSKMGDGVGGAERGIWSPRCKSHQGSCGMIHKERLLALCRLDSAAGAAGVRGRGGRGRREWAGCRMRNFGERRAGRGSWRPLPVNTENRSSPSRASPAQGLGREVGVIAECEPPPPDLEN